MLFFYFSINISYYNLNAMIMAAVVYLREVPAIAGGSKAGLRGSLGEGVFIVRRRHFGESCMSSMRIKGILQRFHASSVPKKIFSGKWSRV